MNDPSVERDPFEVLAESFLKRYRAGERPSINDLAALHPEMAEQIRELLPALVMVEQDLSIDPEPQSPPSTRIVGQSRQLGDYRIIREVGRGGMGIVYEAEQISLGRRVALKVLPGHVAVDHKALERFRREAKAAARLHHTNIVPVFEVGHSGELAYYAMQFIHGQGLDQVIEELRRLSAPPEKAVENDPRNPLAAAPTIRKTTSSAADPLKRNLGPVVESLHRGRFETRGQDSCSGDPQPILEMNGSRPIDPAATTAAEVRELDLDLDLRNHPPVADVTTSAVLPGGTAISTVVSSARRQPFFRSVAQIGRQASQGLAHAHDRGIIHRDIKPSNLLLDTAGVVWITDFGLAKAEDDGLTATGDVLGTIRYMAPERFRGEGDARADIYALGLTLYELLTLKPAYHSSDRLKLIEWIKAEEPARPRSLDDRIPRDLETIILKAIDKEPARRYSSAEAMAEDLRRFLNDEPIQARRASQAERYARWARHHPAIAVLVAVLTAVLVLSSVASLIVAGIMSDLATRERNSASAERKARQAANLQAKAEALAHAEAEAARTAAVAETYRATLSEVKALRAGREPGWRELALSELTRLATMPTPRRDLSELRSEAVDTLGTPDIRLVARIALPGRAAGSFAFSPDGRTILTADPKMGLDFWDVLGNRHLSSVESLTVGKISTFHDMVVYLPGGQGLAVGTDEGVIFADLQGIRTTRAPITQGSSKPTKLSISANGQRIAVAWTLGAGITVHDAASGDLLDRFKDANPYFVLDADGKWLARQENSDTVLKPIASREQSVVLGRHGSATALDLSPNGTILAVAIDHTFGSASDHTTVLWDVVKREQLGVLRGHRGQITDIAFSPDGEWIATGSYDYTTRIWEARTGQNVAILHGTPITVSAVKWSPTGDHLAVSNSQEIFLFNIAGRQRVQRWLTGHRIEQSRLASHPRLERLATSGYSELNSWDLSVPRPSPTLMEPNPGWVTSLTYSPDGSLLATASWRGSDYREVLIREAITGKVRSRISATDIPRTLAFDPTGERLAVGDIAGKIVVLDVATGRPVRQFATGSTVNSIVFLDRSNLLTHSRDAVLRFNLDSGKLERRVDLAGGDILRLVHDRSRGRLVVGFQNGAIGSVALPDLNPGPRLAHAHGGEVICMALSPDERLLATIGGDRLAVLRDAMTFEVLLKFPLRDGNPFNLAFDCTGRRLAIVNMGEDVELWDLGALGDGLKEIGLAWDRDSPAVLPSSRIGPDGADPKTTVPIIRRPGSVPPTAVDLASRLVQSGVGAFQGGHRTEAIRDLLEARDRLRTLSKAASADDQVARLLGLSLGFLGSALRDEHRLSEAHEAVQESRQVLEAIRQPTYVDLYNLTCAYANLSILAEPHSRPPSSAEREILADRAMESLRRALAAGMTDFALMDRDRDLDPLRERPDFRDLTLDRSFPSHPFADSPSPTSSVNVEESFRAELLKLSADVDRRPSDFETYYARGRFFAQHVEWPRALSDFRKALELHPPGSWDDQESDTWFGFSAGLVFLQSGDLEGHRRIARIMLEQFAGSDRTSTRDRTAKINVFANPPDEDLKKIGDLADRSIQLGEGQSGLCWLQLTRGMVSYRSGDFASAVNWLRQAESSGLDDHSLTVARFYLAMAEHQLGKTDQARTLFHQANQTFDTKARQSDWGDGWSTVLEIDLTRREAQALIFEEKLRPVEAIPRR